MYSDEIADAYVSTIPLAVKLGPKAACVPGILMGLKKRYSRVTARSIPVPYAEAGLLLPRARDGAAWGAGTSTLSARRVQQVGIIAKLIGRHAVFSHG